MPEKSVIVQYWFQNAYGDYNLADYTHDENQDYTVPVKSGDAVNASAHATETKSYNDEGYTLSARNGAAPASITYQDAYSGDVTVINIYYDQKMPTISFQIHNSWED